MTTQTSRAVRLREGDVVQQSLDERTVVLDLRSSLYLEVNEAGTFLLSLLETWSSRELLAAALAAHWELDADVAARDVDAFLAALRKNGLLEEA